MAESTDGVIEAVWKPGTFGVQWHPEIMIETDYRWINLFRWFHEKELQYLVQVKLVLAMEGVLIMNYKLINTPPTYTEFQLC